jgi:hypothetical protein
MCVDCVLTSPRIAQVDPDDGPLPEVVLSQLRSARLIYHDQMIMTRHAKALNKTNELISILVPTLCTIKHIISQVKLINMRRFASYSKPAKVSKKYRLSLSHDYKVVDIIHIVLITTY